MTETLAASIGRTQTILDSFSGRLVAVACRQSGGLVALDANGAVWEQRPRADQRSGNFATDWFRVETPAPAAAIAVRPDGKIVIVDIGGALHEQVQPSPYRRHAGGGWQLLPLPQTTE